MPATTLLDPVRVHLASALTPAPALLGGGFPHNASDLPAVALSLDGVTEPLRGVGRTPAPTLTGALRVDTSLDLANPVVTFPDEVVTLLSDDRKTVSLAHGPLVRADGTATQPFAPGDIRVVRGATTFTPVEGTPAAGEVQVLPELGQLVFRSALPATGTLELGYFVGEWEVRTARYRGVLVVDVFAADLAAADALSRQVETALDDPPIVGLERLSPQSWGPVEAPGPATVGRRRTVTYRFEFESIEPKLATGGGLITTVAVNSSPGPEHFAVTREGS